MIDVSCFWREVLEKKFHFLISGDSIGFQVFKCKNCLQWNLKLVRIYLKQLIIYTNHEQSENMVLSTLLQWLQTKILQFW